MRAFASIPVAEPGAAQVLYRGKQLASHPDWSPDGRFLVFSQNQPGTDQTIRIFVLSLESGTAVQLISDVVNPAFAEYSSPVWARAR